MSIGGAAGVPPSSASAAGAGTGGSGGDGKSAVSVTGGVDKPSSSYASAVKGDDPWDPHPLRQGQ